MAYGPRGSMPHSHGSPIIHILNRINPIPRIDTYFFKIHSNIDDNGEWRRFHNEEIHNL